MTHEGRLVSRKVAALFPQGRSDGAVTVDSAHEFRVSGDRGTEVGVYEDADGVFHHAMWAPGRDREDLGSTNSSHAMHIRLIRYATAHWLRRRSLEWRLPGGQELPAGYDVTRAGAVLTVSWDNGSRWARTIGLDLSETDLGGDVGWYPYPLGDVIESTEHPPGPIGLVPYRGAEPITVAEASREW